MFGSFTCVLYLETSIVEH